MRRFFAALSILADLLSKTEKILSKAIFPIKKTARRGEPSLYNPFTAATMIMIHATMNATPPIGVIAPSILMPVKLKT